MAARNFGPIAPSPSPSLSSYDGPTLKEFPVHLGSHPHDVAPPYSNNGGNSGSIVWYTAQAMCALGKLDTTTGQARHINLGNGSAPHGVILGPDGSPWVTDGGLNAIVRLTLLLKV
jgi:virginiamycin B lyase